MDDDTLKLADNKAALKMLAKHGENEPIPERVCFSDLLVKINRRNKEQNRALLITDKAVYNLMPSGFQCKRRIELTQIGSISVSQSSDEFVIHVVDEYDYRFKSAKKVAIADCICRMLASKYDKKVRKVLRDEDTLRTLVLTKKEARLQALLKQGHDDSDEEDIDGSVGDDKFEMLDDVPSGEKVTVDDFDFMKVLGRGNFGKVMQVRKKDSGEIFALKILKKSAIIAKRQVDHTWSERNILAQAQHPFLMKLRWAFQTESKLYFVLDFLRGGELFFHLKQRRRFTEDEARIMVAEVCMALGHLHTLDVVYRDLKPENVLLDPEGHLCLTDFGLSKELSPENQEAFTFCGTPEYLAPEVIRGSGHTKAVDWWSVGILLYELCVGIPPFYSRNVNEMYDKIQHGVLKFPPFLSEACRSVIVQLLVRDPNERLGSGPTDVEEIQRTAFFGKLDWDQLYRKEISPLYKPRVRSETDVSNFEDTFTREPVVDSPDNNPPSKSCDIFVDFTFVDQPTLAGNGKSDTVMMDANDSMSQSTARDIAQMHASGGGGGSRPPIRETPMAS